MSDAMFKKNRQPIDDNQWKVFCILADIGYKAADVQFIQPRVDNDGLTLRIKYWEELESENVLKEIKEIYPKAHKWDDGENVDTKPRHSLVLE